jgi:hypothetical protein
MLIHRRTNALQSRLAHMLLALAATGCCLAPPTLAVDIPNDFVARDMDRDDDVDLVVASQAGVQVLSNPGSGAFSALPLVASPSATTITSADFNQDLFPDAAVAHEALATVTVFLNTMTGNVAAGATIASGTSPTDLVAADFDLDGKADLAVAVRDAGHVLVLFGDGTGNFPDSITLNAGIMPTFLAVGDFDRDGYPDLAVANGGAAQSINIQKSLGNRTFMAGTPISLPFAPSRLVAGDFDGDTQLDLAASGFDANQIAVRFGDGSLHFSGSGAVLAGFGPRAMAVADIDSDGDLDLAAVNAATTGPGNLANGVMVLYNLGDGASFVNNLAPAPEDSHPKAVVLTDVNGDCLPDVIYSLDADPAVRTVPNTAPAPRLNPKRLQFLASQFHLGFSGRRDVFCRSLDWYFDRP